MRVFVTGATGRVGAALVRDLVADGHEVVGLTRQDAGAERLRSMGASAVLGALEDEAAVSKGARGAQHIYHLAGGLRGAGDMSADRLNRVGTERVLAAVMANPGWRADLRAFTFSSTVAIYGDRSGLWVDEAMRPYPQTRYGESKVAAEEAVLAAAREAGLPARIARLAAVYGRDFPFLMADRIRAGRAWLPGEGRNFVPTVAAVDAVSALRRVTEAGGDGQIYNVADTQPLSLREIYAEVHRAVGGQPARFWSTWVPSYVQEWLADNNERLASRLGRRPRVTPDSLRLFTASSRMKVDRLAKELGFTWAWPDPRAGIAAALAGPAP